MFLNVTVAIRHIDRQSHVTLCHAALHSCSIAPTRFPLDNGLQSPTRKQESHLTQRLMDAERLKNAYETTRNGEEGKAYAAWGRSIRSEGENQTRLAAIAYQTAQITSVWPRRHFVAFIRHAM
jgi:hypothetical protein